MKTHKPNQTKPINQIKPRIHRSLQEGRSSTFSWLQEIENAGRLNTEIENMKRREKLGFADQTSRYDNHQIYGSIEELVTEAILSKLGRIWQTIFFDKLTTNALNASYASAFLALQKKKKNTTNF
jgi:hypothetical protein